MPRPSSDASSPSCGSGSLKILYKSLSCYRTRLGPLADVPRIEIRQGSALQAIQLHIGGVLPGMLSTSIEFISPNILTTCTRAVHLDRKRHRTTSPGCSGSPSHPIIRLTYSNTKRPPAAAVAEARVPYRTNLPPPTRIRLLRLLPRERHHRPGLRPNLRQIHRHQHQSITRRPQPRHLHRPRRPRREVPTDAPRRASRRPAQGHAQHLRRRHLLHHLLAHPPEDHPALSR